MRNCLWEQQSLQVGEGTEEKTGVGRGDQETAVSTVFGVSAEDECHHYKVLFFQPFERFCTHRPKWHAESFEVRAFIGWLVIADDHAVGVAPPHNRLGIIDGKSIFAPRYGRLGEGTFTGNVIDDFIDIAVGVAHRPAKDVTAVSGKVNGFCLLQDRDNFFRQP